jgi:hypothetical protein
MLFHSLETFDEPLNVSDISVLTLKVNQFKVFMYSFFPPEIFSIFGIFSIFISYIASSEVRQDAFRHHCCSCWFWTGYCVEIWTGYCVEIWMERKGD